VAGDWEDKDREKRVVEDWDKLPVAFISAEGRAGVVKDKDCEKEVEEIKRKEWERSDPCWVEREPVVPLWRYWFKFRQR
jgi:hypothetical protein